MNWHIEHHMFAGVPCYNLKKLHSCVADDMPNPRTLIGAWKEMRATWRKQQNDPGYQFDTLVPSYINKNFKDSENPLESSIGDLAPKSLV
jgi:fatty acid desaturase